MKEVRGMDLLLALCKAVVLAGELVLAVPLAYLALLSFAALAVEARARSGRRSDARDTVARARARGSLPRFALLIPAHDEAAVISRVLESVHALEYPPAYRSAIVVADNCTDETARIARAAGVAVYERFDAAARAKGYALRWLLEQLDAQGQRYDAYIIVDADSQLSPNFLREMANALASGAQVAQAQYRVLNGDDGWTAGLRAVAIALFNHLRPLGRSSLGWSAGLKGNGMCFRRDVFERFGWGSYSLAEDAEYHIQLLNGGIHVRYVPDAIVSAEMPVTLGQARTQQARWERGRVELARAYVGQLLRGFLRTGDTGRLDVAMELALPPLSLMVGAVGAVAVFACLLRWTPALWLALGLVLALALHVVIGAALARLSWRAYLSLARAPLYIAWKCWVYLVALLGRGNAPWVRTQRVGTK